jgi:PAS domain S-box-containing protein
MATAMNADRVNILLVDDQPAKLLSYEVILEELGENLVKANSAQQALEHLLKLDVAVLLIDVCMPELDGFELAAMIREHPRFQKTAIIFISAVLLGDVDRLRGYEMGAVDYVPVPVIPEVLRAKVRVFAELYRKTRDLQNLNQELERRVAERTAELESSTAQLLATEQRRSLALAAGQMGSWEWDPLKGTCIWDEGQCRIFGRSQDEVSPTPDHIQAFLHPEDWPSFKLALVKISQEAGTFQTEFRVCRPNGDVRWCIGTAVSTADASERIVRVSGVTIDITDRKETEARQSLLAREVDHRARNALAVTQAIVRLTKAPTVEGYMAAVQGRISALARTHTLLSEARWQGAEFQKLAEEELAPYMSTDSARVFIEGPSVSLQPAVAQSLALVIHELATNAAKYGALCSPTGRISLNWEVAGSNFTIRWVETGVLNCRAPVSKGFGTKILNATVEAQLRGRAAFEWEPDGLRCELSFPLQDVTSSALTHASSVNALRRSGSSEQLSDRALKKVLLVEDEAMVGLMMADLISDFGYSVIGPVGKVAEALAAARESQLDGAVLDVNLNGDLVYAVAELLAARGVPFIFVTGYGAETIDKRFANVPVFQKPVEREVLRNALLTRMSSAASWSNSRFSVAERI